MLRKTTSECFVLGVVVLLLCGATEKYCKVDIGLSGSLPEEGAENATRRVERVTR